MNDILSLLLLGIVMMSMWFVLFLSMRDAYGILMYRDDESCESYYKADLDWWLQKGQNTITLGELLFMVLTGHIALAQKALWCVLHFLVFVIPRALTRVVITRYK